MSDLFPRPEPRDPFRRALRARLMAEAALLARRETAWTRFQRSFGRGWVRPALAIGVALLVVGLGAGTAAADSLPGDLAFGLKRAAEELQLTLALDDTTRLRILAEQSDHRLAELSEAVAKRPSSAPTASAEFRAAVVRFTAAVDALRGRADTSADKRAEAGDVADAARAKHTAVLDELEKRASPETKSDVDRAKDEVEGNGPSDRPARTPEPGGTDRPDRTRSPEPLQTAPPTRTPEPSRSPERDGSRGGATPTATGTNRR